jgi:hypothetical protein
VNVFSLQFNYTIDCVHKPETKEGKKKFASELYKLQHTNRDEREEELASVGVDADGLVRLRVYWLGAADLEGRPRTEAAQGKERGHALLPLQIVEAKEKDR